MGRFVREGSSIYSPLFRQLVKGIEKTFYERRHGKGISEEKQGFKTKKKKGICAHHDKNGAGIAVFLFQVPPFHIKNGEKQERDDDHSTASHLPGE